MIPLDPLDPFRHFTSQDSKKYQEIINEGQVASDGTII